MAAPEIIVGAVIVVGVVAVAVAVKEALDTHEFRGSSPEELDSESQTTKFAPRAISANQKPKPEPSGQDWFPPVPHEPRTRERRPECSPKRVPPKGGNVLHNWCADNVPFNAFRGANVLVNGKTYDALQPAARTLWEVKTTAIETYNPFVQRTELQKQVEEGRRERDLATTCGYDFVVGVRTEAHEQLLRNTAPDLKVVLMTWCQEP
ncbi:DUF6310 domain-containing protein [Corallococcus macrosporus]|uniref:DUF6310 domain-containing protein n=1 Tax=Corallococcus macrosporus TaxID=35 RepID=UPI0030846F0E